LLNHCCPEKTGMRKVSLDFSGLPGSIKAILAFEPLPQKRDSWLGGGL
jgi:hypothetical protein